MKYLMNKFATYIFSCFIFGSLQLYECREYQNSCVSSRPIHANLRRPLRSPLLPKEDPFCESLPLLNQNFHTCRDQEFNEKETRIFNFIWNENMIYENVITLIKKIRLAFSIIQILTNNLLFCVYMEMQQFEWEAVSIVKQTSHFLLIIAATIFLLLLKWTGCLFKYKCLHTFELFRRPLLQEMENIKHDTSKLADVLRENNEKLSRIIITKEQERNSVCNETMSFLRNIAQCFHAILTQRKQVKRIIGKQRRRTIVKKDRVPQRKNTGSQTETKQSESKLRTYSNDDIGSNLDITKYTSVKETLSQLHNKRYSPGISTSSNMNLLWRPQRIWIGGKWYLEDRNELKEAYSPPFVQNNTCCRVKVCKENEISEHNISFTKFDIAQGMRSSTPCSAGTTPSFPKYINREEKDNYKRYNSEGIQSPLLKCQRKLDWNTSFQSSNNSNSVLLNEINNSPVKTSILREKNECINSPRIFTCRSYSGDVPPPAQTFLPNQGARIKDAWRNTNKGFDSEDVFMNTAGQLTKQKYQQIGHEGFYQREKINALDFVKLRPNEMYPAVISNMLKDATNLPYRVKNKLAKEIFNLRCHRGILKHVPTNSRNSAVKHVRLKL